MLYDLFAVVVHEGGAYGGAKNALLRHFHMKPGIFLPRQARDKRNQTLTAEVFSAGHYHAYVRDVANEGGGGGGSSGAESPGSPPSMDVEADAATWSEASSPARQG